MVPGAATSKLQKMQLRRQDCMHIEIVDKKKRQFRRLWIIRINAAARQHGLSYSQFISGLKAKGIDLDRKVLAGLAMNEPNSFAELAKAVNS